MKLLSSHPLNLAVLVEQLGPRLAPYRGHNKTHHSANLLQRTQAGSNEETADARYWTVYDHFMVEREARARRREYVYGLVATVWRRLGERLRPRHKLASVDGARGSR
jgi:hypothetical protein